ncbi:MAG: hypothetical protein H7A16_08475 [Sinobacteraceae bacterium]|nr:hypothetical protein [Nevskiaceae bacterium]
MNPRLRQLELRQRALVLRSTLQRRSLADQGMALGARFSGVESKVALARRILSWPALGAGAATMLAAVGPQRLLRVVSRLLVLATVTRRAWRVMETVVLRTRTGGRGRPPPPRTR